MSLSPVRRILIADEDHEMRDLISGLLVAEYGASITIQSVGNGRDVLKKIKNNEYDLAILNWALPELSKTELFQEIRNVRNAAELAILAVVSSADTDLVASVLEAGASDVLCKPFERSHLSRRVKAFIQTTEVDAPGKMSWGELSLDSRTQDVYFRSDRIRLTPSEFKLLQALVEHRGAVLDREKLIELVQGEGIAVIDRAVDTHIFSLRKKLGTSADMVQTVRGSGYRIKELS